MKGYNSKGGSIATWKNINSILQSQSTIYRSRHSPSFMQIKINFSFHSDRLQDPAVSQLNPVHVLSHVCLYSSHMLSFTQGPPTETLNVFPIYDVRANILPFRSIKGGLKNIIWERTPLDLHHAVIFTVLLTLLGYNIGIIIRIL